MRTELYANCRLKDCFSCPYPDCIAEIKEKKHSKPTAEQLARSYAKQKAKRDFRRENGLCVMCGKKLPDAYEYVNCPECHLKMRKAYKRRGHIPREQLDGITRCSKCGKYPPYDGHKVCRRCYENNLKFFGLTPTHNGKKPNNHFQKLNEGFWNEKTYQIKGTG